jgi:hypothetical protein
MGSFLPRIVVQDADDSISEIGPCHSILTAFRGHRENVARYGYPDNAQWSLPLATTESGRVNKWRWGICVAASAAQSNSAEAAFVQTERGVGRLDILGCREIFSR